MHILAIMDNNLTTRMKDFLWKENKRKNKLSLSKAAQWMTNLARRFKICQSSIQYAAHWVDGTNKSSSKFLMFQALFFFIISYILRALKTLYFCKSMYKKRLKWFLKRILQEIMKKKYWLEHQTLGQKAICPSIPAYYIVDSRISKCMNESKISFQSHQNQDQHLPTVFISRAVVVVLLQIHQPFYLLHKAKYIY